MLLVLVLAAVCAALLYWGMMRPERAYEFPFLAGGVFAGWILPQLTGLIGDPFLPVGALEKTVLMSILCASACYLGYVWTSRSEFSLTFDYDERRLLWAGGALSLIGGYFYFSLSRLPEEMTSMTQFTGLPVAYLFFAGVLTYGFAVSTLLFFRTGSLVALGFVLLSLTFYMDRIVYLGRRGDILKVIFTILLALWFQRGKLIPRPLLLVGALVGALMFNSIPEYRAIVMNEDSVDWTRLIDIDLLGNLQRLTERGENEEITNAVYIIEATDRDMSFDFGLFHWNNLVFNYVPAQLVGQDFKDFLMIDLGNSAGDQFGYSGNVGTTNTGMTDAFGSFWYFGAMKFFLIAAIMAMLYRSAMQGNISAQLCYMVVVPASMHSITHHTHWFVFPWVHMAIFFLPALLWARRLRSAPRREAAAHAGVP